MALSRRRMKMSKRFLFVWTGILTMMICSPVPGLRHSDCGDWMMQSLSPAPPANPVRVIFIHHSTGENWLSDENGGLGIALRNNNYYVSDTNYGWGPDNIGDRTDIGNWWEWFRGPDSSAYLNALYSEGDQHSSYSRLPTSPSGENEIIMFKSCFPNSALLGKPDDPVPLIDGNSLRGEGSGSEDHTVANAKGIYIDLLEYFRTRQDKLFVVITAPPLKSNETSTAEAAKARAFNNWLVNEWLAGYLFENVAVFDFYNVLTSNGGNANTNDVGAEGGNHHRWWNGAIQHIQTLNYNKAAYPTGDSHPSQAGNLKATGEFVNLLNIAYHRWKGDIPVGTEVVYTPSTPSGPDSGIIGTDYSFTADGATSSLGHPIEYRFDWGDGTFSDWSSLSEATKSWSDADNYLVRAQAHCANHPSIESGWSDAFNVTISAVGPDLTGEWTTQPYQTTCRSTSKGTKCTVKGSLTIRNIGNRHASSTYVGFYLSDEDTYDGEGNPFKRLSTGKIKVRKSKAIKLSYSFWENVKDKYIIAVIEDDSLGDINEANNMILYGLIQ